MYVDMVSTKYFRVVISILVSISTQKKYIIWNIFKLYTWFFLVVNLKPPPKKVFKSRYLDIVNKVFKVLLKWKFLA
jgi:hypothetical protein